MELQKLNVKFYFANSAAFRLDEFINVFNLWIQSSDGVFYDLADYRHVNEGPGVLLIADEANISIDNAGGRLGLLYNFKRRLNGSNENKLRSAFQATLGYCRKIEQEPALPGKLRFSGNEALLVINDRLIAPNAEATYAALLPDLEEFARRLYGGDEFSLERNSEDARERFAVAIKSPVAHGIESLTRNLVQGQDGMEGLSVERQHRE
jgi:hypothetical protein